MRLPDGKNGVVRRAARESEPGFGAIFALAGREQQYIAPALMIPFVVMVGDVILQSETKRLLSEEYELRQHSSFADLTQRSANEFGSGFLRAV